MIFKRIFLTLTITTCLGGYISAQKGKEMIDVWSIRQDIYTLENRITSLIKKDPVLSKMQGLQQFHVFWLGYVGDSIKKSEYLDSSFLYKLRPTYCNLSPRHSLKKKQKYLYLATMTYICDSNGRLLAKGDARRLYAWEPITYMCDYDVAIVKMFSKRKIDVSFMGERLGVYFMIKDEDIWVLDYIKDGYKEYSLEEFVNCCL
ncbi:MAG: hypothetical protein LBQ31_08575 [Bacteroidales bacterium]|jgi:hypothetical protein|nr:hypothetical protein [Bacteroidales bacterium]